jgi:hypothetical protein
LRFEITSPLAGVSFWAAEYDFQSAFYVRPTRSLHSTRKIIHVVIIVYISPEGGLTSR